jgi:rod shape-determining protein MreC
VDLFLRYRNIAVLIAALFSQLVLLGYQVRQEDGSSLLRTWTVGLLAPINQGVHSLVESGADAWREYVWLVGARDENEKLRAELDTLRIQKQALERELGRVGRVTALVRYQADLASATVLAEVVGGGASGSAKEIIIDKGSADGVAAGMAVITSEGVVGRIQAAHSSSSLVVLINDVNAAVGGILEDTRVRGVLRGRGGRECELQYINPDVPVRIGEIVYTSGADRIFPKGLPVGEVVDLEQSGDSQTIMVRPFAQLDRLDEVLVVTNGVHQELPERREAQQPTALLPPASEADDGIGTELTSRPSPLDIDLTDADRLRRQYERIGAAQGHTFGEGLPGSRPPDFNLRAVDPANPAADVTAPPRSAEEVSAEETEDTGGLAQP